MIKQKLLLATTNQGKAKEIKRYLAELPLEILSLDDLPLKSTFLEKGKTFLENARGKSLFYSQQCEYLILAEDSGLEIKSLDGAPGIFSARFSSPRPTDEKNIQKVLKLMRGVPLEQRKAQFTCYLVLSQKGKIIKEIKGTARGWIGFKKKGNCGFGYDPIFYYSPLQRTFAELEPEEKNQISHRGRALKKLKAFLAQYLGRWS